MNNSITDLLRYGRKGEHGMKIGESDSDYCACSHLLGILFHSRTQTHWWHLQTTSHALHVALGEYYNTVPDLADRFAEAYMGCYGMRPKVNQEQYPLEDLVNPSIHFDMVQEAMMKVRSHIEEKGDLLNIVDEIIELVHKVKYLLTLK